jgi:hypothetical protein
MEEAKSGPMEGCGLFIVFSLHVLREHLQS